MLPCFHLKISLKSMRGNFKNTQTATLLLDDLRRFSACLKGSKCIPRNAFRSRTCPRSYTTHSLIILGDDSFLNNSYNRGWGPG